MKNRFYTFVGKDTMRSNAIPSQELEQAWVIFFRESAIEGQLGMASTTVKLSVGEVSAQASRLKT